MHDDTNLDPSIDALTQAQNQRAGLYRALLEIVDAVEQGELGYALPAEVLEQARAMLDLCADG